MSTKRRSKSLALLISTVIVQIACLGVISGCVSQRGNETLSAPHRALVLSGVDVGMSPHLGEELAAALSDPTLTKKVTLAGLVTNFHTDNKRWPKDQAELSGFIAQSNGKLPPIPYDHVEFREKWFGGVRVCAVSRGITNRITVSDREVEVQ